MLKSQLQKLIQSGFNNVIFYCKAVFILNEEIRNELIDVVMDTQWSKFLEFQLKSNELVRITLDKDCKIMRKF